MPGRLPVRRLRWLLPALVASALDAGAAVLPTHDPLRILVVSDEVNPHALTDGELTQPGEISAALLQANSGLTLDSAPDTVLEISTDSIEQATALLALPVGHPDRYDVLIYFSHRIPLPPNAVARQAAFTAAVEQFLIDGGGLVVFHHGAYLTAGKEQIQELIGATATGAVPWDSVNGQNVINVSPTHFVGCYGVAYDGERLYADPARGVPAARYAFLNNTPDERYPNYEFNPSAESVQTLFGSDYDQNGSTHLLGFTHRRDAWAGKVVAYQPGEHQPTALDVDGANFQILANAIVWAARRVPDDGIRLRVSRGPGDGDVTLDWEACALPMTIYAAAEPESVASAPNAIGGTIASSFVDSSPTLPLSFYQVRAKP